MASSLRLVSRARLYLHTHTLTVVFTAQNFTTSMFDDEDKVLCIIRERVGRSLSRDNLSNANMNIFRELRVIP